MDALERGHIVAACRGKRLAAALVLSGPEACRSPGLGVPWLVFPASSSCRGLVALPERVARHGKFLGAPWLAFPASLPGKLLLPGSCLLSLNTLFLDGSKGTLGDLGVRPASLCRGVLQLPVHKFGVLGYP